MTDLFSQAGEPKPPPLYNEWKAWYYKAVRLGWTFKQATHQFFEKYGKWPADDMPLLPPRNALIAWARRVEDVPVEQLNPDPWG